MILLIDNYDSFTYNLFHAIAQIGEEVIVRRNDAVLVEDVRNLKPASIFLSPGPRSPRDAGITVEVIRQFYRVIPIMGVCLGHQICLWRRGDQGRTDQTRQDLSYFP
jgi:anthranilate synthase/aminodeoxychorismate synthase-like glutamine amidotransferase